MRNQELDRKFDELLKAALQQQADKEWEEDKKAEESDPEYEFFQTPGESAARIAYIRKESRKVRRRARKKQCFHVLHRAVIVAAVLVLVILIQSAISKSVDASKDTVMDVMVNYFKEFTEVKNQASEYLAVKYEVREPGYIPEGYELVKKTDGELRSERIYRNRQGQELWIVCTPVAEGYAEGIDKEDKNICDVKMLQYEALYFFSDEEDHTLLWKDDTTNYRIEARLELGEMIKIGESMMKN